MTVTASPPANITVPRRATLTIRHVWVGLTLAATFIGPASAPIGVPDGLWSLLRGAWMVSHRRLLEADPFTSAPHVAGPMLNVQWLADVALYGVESVGGMQLVITATALVLTVTYGVLLWATCLASGHLRLSCAVVWAAYVMGVTNFSPRPQTLSYALFALFLLAVVLYEWRGDRRLLWVLPPATALWANLHGSFVVGFLLLGCAVGAQLAAPDATPLIARLRRARPYLFTLAACLLASLANPYGAGALYYVLTIGSNPIIREHVTEWSPTTVTSPEGVMFFGALALVGALALRSRVRLTLLEALLLLAFGYLAWASVRGVVWFGIVLAPTLARLLGGVLPPRHSAAQDRPLVNALVLLSALSISVLSTPWAKSALPILPSDKQGLYTPQAPVAVGEYLNTHDPPPHGRMFNHQTWGGYLEWATWPRHQVFVDGRFELHSAEVWFDYSEMVFPSARWRALFDRYEISYTVLNKTEEVDLVADLRADPAWRLDYEDAQAVVFTRIG